MFHLDYEQERGLFPQKCGYHTRSSLQSSMEHRKIHKFFLCWYMKTAGAISFKIWSRHF